MKNSFYSFAAVLVLSIFMFTGCSKDSDPPTGPGGGNGPTSFGSITINGAGFNNKVVNFATGGGTWIDSLQATGIALSSAPADSMQAIILFRGTAAGEYDWQGTSEDNTFDGVAVLFYNGRTLAPMTGKTTITGYGNIGQNIEGSFQGTVMDMQTQENATISGSFKALHVEEGEGD